MNNDKIIRLLKAHGCGYAFFEGKLLAIEEVLFGANERRMEATDVTGWSMHKLMAWLGY